LPLTSVTLINADGSSLCPAGTATAQVALNGLDTPHTFTVVNDLSTPVILGCDFLSKHGVLLDFSMNMFHCKHSCVQPQRLSTQTESLNMLVLDDDLLQAVPCPIPQSSQTDADMPENYHPALESVLRNHKALFSCQLGKTNVARHVIDTGDSNPVKSPLRSIPFHYTEQVHNQLQEMAKEGIIIPSNSPWCDPAVYVPKSNGEVRICVDFLQINKLTKKRLLPCSTGRWTPVETG